MGYMRHNAILVTGSYHLDGSSDSEHWADHARAKVAELCGVSVPVTAVCEGAVNDARSFAVLPDGSKEGWANSDEGDAARERVVDWLKAQEYEDGSSPLSWAEVQYGDDDGVSAIIRHSDEPNGTEARPYPA